MEPPPRPPPALPDDIIEAILLRFPPDDTASLLRAALVCKPWCRLVSGGSFRRRFRQFHRTPPMLGLLHNTEPMTRFVPTSSFRPPHGGDKTLWKAMDARHGRILLRAVGERLGEPMVDRLVVWDPITGEMTGDLLPIPANTREYLYNHSWSAAVLCANGDACDHLDCHRGPFQVVIVVSDNNNQIDARVYSWEAGSWSQTASSQLQHRGELDFAKPSTLVEDSLYFVLRTGTILKYNLASQQEMSAINLPPAIPWPYVTLLTTVTLDGRLGFAVTGNSKLHLWLRETGHDGDAGWTKPRVIDLKRLLHVDNLLPTSFRVLGLAGGIGFCFVLMGDAVFSIDLKSSQAKKVRYVSGSGSGGFLPYMNFCTPSIRSKVYR